MAAQHFGGASPSQAGVRRLLGLVRGLGALQRDSVNVLVRSHYLPLFSRLGAYDRGTLERLAYENPRRLFEYWAHEASLVPVEFYPLLHWRMLRARAGRGMWKGVAQIARDEPSLVERVRTAIASRGPMSASDFEDAERSRGWWGWSKTKRALEYLLWSGVVAAARRRASFEREYDVVERVIPRAVLDRARICEREAQRELVRIAARACGIATEADLRAYFRLDAADAQACVRELVESGDLLPTSVEGWNRPAYLARGARLPRRVEGSAPLSPFDSLVWDRERTKRLFGFDYRLEIYTPSHKRIHGYYVLPYLLDGALVARVDLKADRQARVLLARAVHVEPGAERAVVRERLREDLRRMAHWLGLEHVRMPR